MAREFTNLWIVTNSNDTSPVSPVKIDSLLSRVYLHYHDYILDGRWVVTENINSDDKSAVVRNLGDGWDDEECPEKETYSWQLRSRKAPGQDTDNQRQFMKLISRRRLDQGLSVEIGEVHQARGGLPDCQAAHQGKEWGCEAK